MLNGEIEPTKSEQLIGIGGIFLISITTMIEAKIAHNKAIVSIEEKLTEKLKKKKRRPF